MIRPLSRSESRRRDRRGSPILQIPVQTIGLLHQDGSARRMMLFQIREHLVECGSAALLGGLDIDEFLGNDKALVAAYSRKQALLRRDAE